MTSSESLHDSTESEGQVKARGQKDMKKSTAMNKNTMSLS
jgi:hypothetical protein